MGKNARCTARHCFRPDSLFYVVFLVKFKHVGLCVGPKWTGMHILMSATVGGMFSLFCDVFSMDAGIKSFVWDLDQQGWTQESVICPWICELMCSFLIVLASVCFFALFHTLRLRVHSVLNRETCEFVSPSCWYWLKSWRSAPSVVAFVSPEASVSLYVYVSFCWCCLNANLRLFYLDEFVHLCVVCMSVLEIKLLVISFTWWVRNCLRLNTHWMRNWERLKYTQRCRPFIAMKYMLSAMKCVHLCTRMVSVWLRAIVWCPTDA